MERAQSVLPWILFFLDSPVTMSKCWITLTTSQQGLLKSASIATIFHVMIVHCLLSSMAPGHISIRLSASRCLGWVGMWKGGGGLLNQVDYFVGGGVVTLLLPCHIPFPSVSSGSGFRQFFGFPFLNSKLTIV